MTISGLNTLPTILGLLTIFATAVMAASAALQAARHGLDPFGATVLGLVTAVGGGTVRDLLLGLTPVFWIEDARFLATAIPASLVSYVIAQRMPSGNGQRHRLLLRLDAIGLALFTLLGTQVALDAGFSGPTSVIVGCVTGTVGGMIRDLLCSVTPSVLKEDLYATISLAGGSLFVLTLSQVPENSAVLISFAAMLAVRLLVLELGNRKPT